MRVERIYKVCPKCGNRDMKVEHDWGFCPRCGWYEMDAETERMVAHER